MGRDTAIEWAHHSFNPWWGCQRVSPGCENCYAEALDGRFHRANPHWGPGAKRKAMSQAYWRQPYSWNRRAASGELNRVFCASMCDVFEDGEFQAAQRQRLWCVIRATPNLDWLLLTKRPQNFGFLPWVMYGDAPWTNVWLGVTAEDQKRAEERIPLLLDTPATLRFISYEPALEEVNFHKMAVDWVICGAESGPGARPFDDNWARSVREQCQEAGVPFFYKQKTVRGKKVSLPELDGQIWAEVPIPRSHDEQNRDH